MAPTYLCRFPGSASYGRRGSALFDSRDTGNSLFPVTLRCSAEGRASKGDGPSASAGILRGPRCAQAPQDDGSGVETVSNQKAELRADAQTRRDSLPANERKTAAETIASRKFPLTITPSSIISGFMPLKSEINPLPLLQKLAEAGARLALPAIAERGKPLIMRAWEFGAPLDRGQWGIREPKADASEVEPDILLVPLLAFDRAGYRLGYGAGYYDMTIHRLRALKPVIAVGIAFAAQEVAKIPTTPRDERLDLVLTEREVIDLRGV
jgi:5-formyltetrahydrofolate cyclo-ligase